MLSQPTGHSDVIEPKQRGHRDRNSDFHFVSVKELGRDNFINLSFFCLFFPDGKLYDAYVLYPKPQRKSQRHNVDTLVLKILPKVLETQCGYKLFIFGRDEFPGQGTL